MPILRPVVLALAALAWIAVGSPALATDSIAPVDAIKHVAQLARVCGKVVSAKYAQSVRRNLDQPYPNQVFTAVIWGDARRRFKTPPESLRGHSIGVTGTITLYRKRAEMDISDSAQVEPSPRNRETS